MADIEAQGQGDGKKAERPSYTRLCTCKILPICLAICIISIFSAAIVSTSLNQPVPSKVVIVISTIASCLLFLIFAGYLKIYHDKNGMAKVHPHAEQAFKTFRDRFVSYFCCVEMDDCTIPHITINNHGEAEKAAPKENEGEGNVQPNTRFTTYRPPPARKPLPRPSHTVQGPREQPQTPGTGPSRPQDVGHHLQQQQQQYRPYQRRPPAEQPQNPGGNRQPPVSTHHQARPVPPARNPELSQNLDESMQSSSFDYGVPRDHRFAAALPGDDSRYSRYSQQQTRNVSAEVPPLNPAQARQWQNDQVANLVSVPDATAQLQAILDDQFTNPLKRFAKATRPIYHEEGTEHHKHCHEIGSPCITPTQSRKSASASRSTTMTNASSTSSKTPSSSNSSILLSTPPPRRRPPMTAESLTFPQFPAQCHTEQKIWRSTACLLAQHRVKYHTKHDPTGFTYCRPPRSKTDESTSQSGD